MPELVRALVRFPLQDGLLAGCDASMTFDSTREAIEALVTGAEPCEAGCGARVAASSLSGDRARFDLPGPLGEMTLPDGGVWEAAHDAVNDEQEPVLEVAFHDVDRCRELRGLPPIEPTTDEE